jgi:RNA polymerase sigma-70 factor (ECF subfamily)
MHERKLTYDRKYPFTAWLFTMVKTTMIDDFRKTRTRSKVLKQTENTEVGDHEEYAPVPEMSLTDQLDESQKKLLELRYLEEWSFEEMAKEFKVNTATIRKRISRLLKQLRGVT